VKRWMKWTLGVALLVLAGVGFWIAATKVAPSRPASNDSSGASAPSEYERDRDADRAAWYDRRPAANDDGNQPPGWKPPAPPNPPSKEELMTPEGDINFALTDTLVTLSWDGMTSTTVPLGGGIWVRLPDNTRWKAQSAALQDEFLKPVRLREGDYRPVLGNQQRYQTLLWIQPLAKPIPGETIRVWIHK